MKKLKVVAEVNIPTVPNFLQLSNGGTIAVSDISDDGLREIAKGWTEALLERAAEQRAKW